MSSPAAVLSLEEIGRVFAALVRVCGVVEGENRNLGGAGCIQLPKIPPALSESLALHALRTRQLLSQADPESARLRGGADITALSRTGERLRVEVKATGSSEFITLGRKDREAEALLWLLFGDALRAGQLESFRVIVLEEPGRWLSGSGDRLTLSALRAMEGVRIAEVELTFPDLAPAK